MEGLYIVYSGGSRYVKARDHIEAARLYIGNLMSFRGCTYPELKALGIVGETVLVRSTSIENGIVGVGRDHWEVRL